MSKSCCLKTVTFLRTIKHASEKEYPKMNLHVEPSFAILVGNKTFGSKMKRGLVFHLFYFKEKKRNRFNFISQNNKLD
jgi:hypothetical protein